MPPARDHFPQPPSSLPQILFHCLFTDFFTSASHHGTFLWPCLLYWILAPRYLLTGLAAIPSKTVILRPCCKRVLQDTVFIQKNKNKKKNKKRKKKKGRKKRQRSITTRKINSEVYEFLKRKVMIILVLLVLHILAGSI